jgi:hypothetical protein
MARVVVFPAEAGFIDTGGAATGPASARTTVDEAVITTTPVTISRDHQDQSGIIMGSFFD